MIRFIMAALAAIAFIPCASAQSPGDNITVSHAWARATPFPAANAAVYLTITANQEPDTLTGASTPIASKAGLHESTSEGGIMRMRPVESLAIDKDHPATLAPGGFHLMLTGMKQQLKAGETFPLTLAFTRAGAVQVIVQVVQAGAEPMTSMDMGH